ncbi:MAG: class I SAM-dependent methyltransferase [Cyanobacteria bacterium]|nr:class I SAM-dependent methyltransferase [Cyanobacteria bacterium CG_2015-16_32_12]NCO77850.1 class I SAM-dependent methyltransferase [Cyanobacteria bacterium CG_2015-22_32_23]NCQ03391.1 class I SAM-dependent methyltransferase [Cyanobacteria bacterium CG_2015-09_32_10]NCQ41688.1 class I SAM-dependent methyltransferase [Cyanobacteria bacterium CG_2015-04_32_10]
MLLQPHQRTKLDDSEDSLFYSFPRFVNHVDDNYINQLKELYRQELAPNSRILDLMSSWVSHLPKEMKFSHVEGHGMNEEELKRNKQLNHYFVQNLNLNPKIPLNDEDFDAVLCSVSVQYLQYPEAIFSEIARILKPKGVAIFSFSNRMFYQKAISAWRDATDRQRIHLVKSYFQSVSDFNTPKIVATQPELPAILQMLGMGGKDPFYAVFARKN